MKKLIMSIGLVLASLLATADEGMWLLQYLADRNIDDMQSKGLKLSAEDIYNINNSSLKDAIVSMGGFCTGEMISSEGLMLTNHHCGFEAIQANSTVEHDYLTDGFWAMSRAEEIPIEGLFVRFMVRMENVTDAILKGIHHDTPAAERDILIQDNMDQAYVDYDEEGYDIEIDVFYEGSEYYLFVYETFTDIRMVGAPPSSVGKFGGDTDNWMWPRHTGDFSLFRVYADADGKPADYSEDNVAYEPKHHLPVSMNGVSEGDFAMIMGYPGSTDRYLSSFGVEEAVNVEQPTRVEIRGAVLDIMKKYMDAEPDVRISYASKYAQIANYWKYFIGQSEQLEKNEVYERKVQLEKAFQEWADADSERKAIYGDVVANIGSATEALSKYTIPDAYFWEAALNMETNILIFSSGALRNMVLFPEQVPFDASVIMNSKDYLEGVADDFYKDYYEPIDKELYVTLLGMYYENVPEEFHPDVLTEIADKYKGDFQKFVDKTWDKSIFTSKERLLAFAENPTEKALDGDYYGRLVHDFIVVLNEMGDATAEATEQLETNKRLFIEGLRLMYPDQNFAPDANSTLRLTYGNVLDYEPKDGVTYNYYTTLDGVMGKDVIEYIERDGEMIVNKNHEFYIPDRLKELYETKDYGDYEVDGSVPVCFIANLDITGGNSGSPVIDGNGNLIGCAFDGNWEAMSGDIAFENEVQRTIAVDIRYILFIIDKYAGATHLIEEMDIVKGPIPEPEPEEEVRVPVEDVSH